MHSFTKGSTGRAGWDEHSPCHMKIGSEGTAVLSDFNPWIYKCSTASLQSMVLWKRTGWTHFCHQTALEVLRAMSQAGMARPFLEGFQSTPPDHQSRKRGRLRKSRKQVLRVRRADGILWCPWGCWNKKPRKTSGLEWMRAGKRIRHLTVMHGGAAMEVEASELLP